MLSNLSLTDWQDTTSFPTLIETFALTSLGGKTTRENLHEAKQKQKLLNKIYYPTRNFYKEKNYILPHNCNFYKDIFF